MRTLALISFLLMAGTSYAEPIDLNAIARIESGGCKNPCIGDKGLALGPYQLHAGAVKDVNKALGTEYSHRDVLNQKVARIVANAYFERVIPRYLRHYGLGDTLENRLTAWNAGIGAVRKGRIVHGYIKKYRVYASSASKNKGLGNG